MEKRWFISEISMARVLKKIKKPKVKKTKVFVCFCTEGEYYDDNPKRGPVEVVYGTKAKALRWQARRQDELDELDDSGQVIITEVEVQ